MGSCKAGVTRPELDQSSRGPKAARSEERSQARRRGEVGHRLGDREPPRRQRRLPGLAGHLATHHALRGRGPEVGVRRRGARANGGGERALVLEGGRFLGWL